MKLVLLIGLLLYHFLSILSLLNWGIYHLLKSLFQITTFLAHDGENRLHVFVFTMPVEILML